MRDNEDLGTGHLLDEETVAAKERETLERLRAHSEEMYAEEMMVVEEAWPDEAEHYRQQRLLEEADEVTKGIMFEDEVLDRIRAKEEAWLAEEMMEADEERAKVIAAIAFSLIVSPGEEEFAAEEEAAQWCGERYLTDAQEQHDHRLEDPEYERGIFHDEQSCDFYGLQMYGWRTIEFIFMHPSLFPNHLHRQSEREWQRLGRMKCPCTRFFFY